jgi:hypothetical protein
MSLESGSSNWNEETEKILDNLRHNSKQLEQHHRNRYFSYKRIVIYVKIPIIFLSALNSVVSVSLQDYISQNYISLMTCGLAFSVGLISSISLMLKIEDNCDIENISARNYHRLSSEISKILTLKPNDRGIDADIFLNQKYSEYISFYDKSNILKFEIKDKLIEVEFFGISTKN